MKHWNRPMAWGFIAFAVIVYGNACAPNFTLLNDENFAATTATCSTDESLINDFSRSNNLKTGYIGSNKVSYINRDDDWIQVHGDMLLPTKGGDLPSAPVPEGVSQGVGVQGSARWPGGRIPYAVASDMPTTMGPRITAAINHWNSVLSGVITLVPRTNESRYVHFTYDEGGCASAVGYFSNRTEHPIYLSQDCLAGNVAHEIGHAVGLDHEQNRLDRDSYVAINFGKVADGYAANFEIVSDYANYNYYDFGSIMHYTLKAFSVDDSQTILPKVAVPNGITVGQRSGLSYGDVNSVRIMYGHAPVTDPGVPATASRGLTGRYFNSFDFQRLVTERVDSQLNFAWGTSAPVTGQNADVFSIRWTGYITPPASGTYNFIMDAQDDVRVLINGQAIFDMTGGNAQKNAVSIPVTLQAGTQYSFLTEYRASTTGASSSVKLSWRMGSGSESVVPSSAFTPDVAGRVDSPCAANWD